VHRHTAARLPIPAEFPSASQDQPKLEAIRQTALRRLLLLFVALFAGLSLASFELARGDLPLAGFGLILILLIVAFSAGISLILRAASRRIALFLDQSTPNATPSAAPFSVLALLRNKTR
jgi:hypothetical protein